ncbi:MAG: response regulator [Planctomycetes bacterium]|nr:response regulator [Planctomycetota bacterium]MCB9830385.1 response regulator [Planctomycetota bacterium]MCB9901370.1 response regulator [Planctomycetota bacterium]
MRPRPTPTAPPPPTRPRGTLLIVDDEPDIPELLERLLAGRGWTIHRAKSGAEALRTLADETVDLMVTDLRMPGMTGLELIEEARQTAPHCGSVLITGYASTETAVEALRKGADDYLTKPFRAEDLEGVLERVLAARRLRRDNDIASHRVRVEAEVLRRQQRAAAEDLARTRDDLLRSRRDRDRRVRDLAFVAELTGLLAREPDLPRVLQRTARILADRFGAESVRLELDGGDGVEVVEWGHGLSRSTGLGGDLTRSAAQDPDGVYMDTVLGGGAPCEALAAVVRQGSQPVGGIALLRAPRASDDREGDRFLLQLVPQALVVALEAARQRQRAERAAVDVAERMVEMLEQRGSLFAGRTARLARIAEAVADAAGLTGAPRAALLTAARLQDVGKISLPDGTLQRAGPLTDGERSVLERHPLVGSRVLAACSDVARLVRHHAERPDGCGYPDRLPAEDIPPAAALVAVIGAYEAMTSPRPWRASRTRREALAEIDRARGGQFTDAAVEALLAADPARL